MAGCIKCQEQKEKTTPEVTNLIHTQENPSPQPGGHVITSSKCMPAEDIKRFGAILHEKMNAAHLRNMPKGVLADLQARARGGEQAKTADLLLYILYNPMNRQKLISGCTHQYDDLSKLIDELVVLYGPNSDD